MNWLFLNSVKVKASALLLLSLFVFLIFLALAQSPEVNAGQTEKQTFDIEDSVIFTEFDAWTAQYLKGRDSGDFIAAGEKLAARRRAVFRTLIESAPESARALAVSDATRLSLPASIARHLEKSVSFKGDFLMRVEDRTDSAGNFRESRTVREVVFGGAKYRAFVYGRKASMTTKYDVPLSGVVLDDALALDENSVRLIEPAEYAALGVDAARVGAAGAASLAGGEVRYFSSRREFQKYAAEITAWEEKIGPVQEAALISPWTEGAKTVLFIRVDFAERPGEPTDQSGAPLTADRALNLINNSVNQYYAANSYNKTSLAATVTPVVRMPQPQSFYTGSNSDFIFTHAREAARAAGFETNNFNLDVIAFGFSNLFGYSGFAKIGAKGAVLNGFFDFKTAAHELGHCYGLLHANTWRTSDGTVTGNGMNVEYGDAFDVMGGGGSQITHFNAAYKRALDWLTEAHVQTVASSGVYRVYAFDVVGAPQGTHALKIKRDGVKNYWLEFRQLFTSTPGLMNGAMVRWDYFVPEASRRQTQVLDMTPTTQTLADSTLLVGQTFEDAAAGLKITVLGKGNTTPESLDVRVEFNFAQIRGAPFDFDGDNKSDVGVFRPAQGVWYVNNSTGGFRATSWGLETDQIVPAKFNNDRLTDLAVYRGGTWYVHNQFGGQGITVQFGLPDDIPIPADYDGDAAAEMAVFRPSNGTWHLWNWIFQRYTAVQFGAPGDVPVPADYDGDNRADIAIYRPAAGEWWIMRSSDGAVYAFQFGTASDKPVQGDYTGDGKTDAAFYRPASGEWFILRSEDSSFYSVPFGADGDVPAPADYDGDGRFDTAVFRPDGATWYINRSSAGIQITNFGLSGDLPLANAFVP